VFRSHLILILLTLGVLSHPARADDRMVDGVPLPSDAAVADVAPGAATPPQWAGAWIGAWGDTLKHILLVEKVGADTARVVYAVGSNPAVGVRPSWSRFDAVVSARSLKVEGNGFSVSYEMTDQGRLKGLFQRGAITSRATMRRANLADLLKPNATVEWTRGKSELLPTSLAENGKPVRLEVVIFRPTGAGPFPLAVVNHGSTGLGRDASLFGQTWSDANLADYLNDRGWIVAFPQRRGRGKSDGLYDEGFGENRKLGYLCDTDITLRGADRALTDIDAAVGALLRRPDVARGPVLMIGQSRGGVLSIAYAGLHPAQTLGVINFVGGWLGEGCPTSSGVNQTLFKRGAQFKRPTLWLYGRNDQFYSIAHSQANFAAFEKAGGRGQFLDYDIAPGQGHFLIGHPDLWAGPVGKYLDTLAIAEKP
jgi:dienelactone hydrolase